MTYYKAHDHYWGGMVDDVWEERTRQITKWGEQHHPDGTDEINKNVADWAKRVCARHAKEGTLTWNDILTEEFYEALAEVEPGKLRVELVQCAAVIAAWIEDIDSRNYVEVKFTQLELPFEEDADA